MDHEDMSRIQGIVGQVSKGAGGNAGFAWGYRKFCANFGFCDVETGKWDEQMLEVLI